MIGGDKETIYPILQWVLERTEDLKLRAYLGKYLVRIEVPPEFLQDPEVAETHTKYMGLIQEFTEVHQDVESHRKSGFSSKDIKEDMISMDQEKEQIIKRIDRIKRKVHTLPLFMCPHSHTSSLLPLSTCQSHPSSSLSQPQPYAAPYSCVGVDVRSDA